MLTLSVDGRTGELTELRNEISTFVRIDARFA
jgi:hypothetical protein